MHSHTLKFYPSSLICQFYTNGNYAQTYRYNLHLLHALDKERKSKIKNVKNEEREKMNCVIWPEFCILHIGQCAHWPHVMLGWE